MPIDPNRIAVEYYFGDLPYWRLPRIATDALEQGHDGPALRRLAGLANKSGGDIREIDLQADEVDSAFCEMGVDAPITKEKARMVLAIESAHRALSGGSNVFDEATHIRIHLCELTDPPEALRQIVNLSKAANNAPRSEWNRVEADLQKAFRDFMDSRQIQVHE